MEKASHFLFFGQYFEIPDIVVPLRTGKTKLWKPPPEPRIIAHDRVELSKGQIPWNKILTWKMLFGPIFVQKTVNYRWHSFAIFFKIKTNSKLIGFLTNSWPNTREHLPSQYLNSRDLAFNKVLIHIIISNYAIFTAATFLLAELSHAASLELKNSYLEIRCLVAEP